MMVLGREGLVQKDNYLILYLEGVWKGSKSRNIPEAPFSLLFNQKSVPYDDVIGLRTGRELDKIEIGNRDSPAQPNINGLKWS